MSGDKHPALTDKALIDKDERLLCHDDHPLQVETPLGVLSQQAFTPTDALYIRNNQTILPDIPTDCPLQISTPAGQIILAKSDVERLASQGHWQETSLVLQCAGNNRVSFEQFAPVAGSLWHSGAVANVVLAGVPVRALFAEAGLELPKQGYLTALGYVSGDDVAFERSVPLADVIDTAFVALTLNGQPLTHLHGGPLRLVVPGYYAVNNVKWLAHLAVTERPTQGFYQIERYRLPHTPLTPGSDFTPSEDNSRPSWRQKVKSLFWSPVANVKRGTVLFAGIAWTDGRSAISKVELSFDAGETDAGGTWIEAVLEPPHSPYAWTRWHHSQLLAPGDVTVWLRATDSLGNQQPVSGEADWNPRGYEWNAIEKMSVLVE
jgi:DMSO/TMAO reductase YedYZ molybdopterin-dependent catalytic subunit